MLIRGRALNCPSITVIALFLLQASALLAIQQEELPGEARVVQKVRAARGVVTKDGEGKVVSVHLIGSTDEQIEAIDFTAFSRLECVAILSPKMTKRSLVHLRKIPPGLLTLKITDTPLDEKELGLLLQRQKALILLSLRDTSITDKTLSEIGKLADLAGLELGGTKFTDIGLRSIANLQDLTILDLSYTNISDAGLREIKKLPNLGALYLSGTKVTDMGIQELGEIEYLDALIVAHTKVTNEGKKALQKMLPDLKFK